MFPAHRLHLNALRAGSRRLSVRAPRTPCPAQHYAPGQHAFAHQTRQFHPSRPTHMVAESIECAHNVLQSVHTITGLPWAASIPLTAILARIVIGLPLHIWSTHSRNLLSALNPVILARGNMEMKKLVAASSKSNEFVSPRTLGVRGAIAMKEFRLKILERQGNKLAWAAPVAPLLQLPFWLPFMECLRAMAGWQPGILVIIQKWFNPDAVSANIPVEQSLSTEGALWFPDLIAADPSYVLPFVLSGLMFSHVTFAFGASKSLASPGERNRLQRIWAVLTQYKDPASTYEGAFMQRVWAVVNSAFQGMSFMVAPLLIHSHAPVALVLYWITTTSVAIIQKAVLNQLMSPPTIPQPAIMRNILRETNQNNKGVQEAMEGKPIGGNKIIGTFRLAMARLGF
ncbi:hypothetical protein AJ79_08259 [Helicocarpus griseus UAMH5409]|uniref:Mitochondrial export translocase Oxa2 n=1 Tax=Helicocarpus griseus UAMH5409 TaxID=1447875 RepID=A0A2B7WTW5_9EURO|nr:hypothetical protein AJ79_08259 [Helicocarpus griseus UAMH5409]